MTKWLQWIVLTSITGSPVMSIALLLVIWWAADRFTFRLLPDPLRPLSRLWKARRLERALLVNPHDRRARSELAELRLAQRRYGAAAELLRANLEAGDEDTATLHMMGVALYATGHADRAERLWDAAEEQDPNYRLGELNLSRGSWRLRSGDARGARMALERLVQQRVGTVQGRVLLAQALAREGDEAAARRERAQAWKEHVSTPFHLQRLERLWAWRANPLRPAMYLAVAILVAVLANRYVAPTAREWAGTIGSGLNAFDRQEGYRGFDEGEDAPPYASDAVP